ncbi:MAG: histidine phosphatase family protein [Parcubacteria group bacterium]|nr:histidine phosphatase family protein [Parcubacteria group bacterium]
MAWPELLVLVRHAESEGNVKSVDDRAEYDVATHAYRLTERGRRQAKITGQYLKDRFGFRYFDVRYISYYIRSKETMEIMCPKSCYGDPYEDPRLAEGQRGIWHTMTKEQIRHRFPEEIERKEREGLYHYRPLGGENWPDMELRIHSFLGTLSRDYAGQKVLIVVHGHWLILFQRLVHHFSIDEAVRKYEQSVIENAAITIYEGITQDGRSRLLLSEENIVPWRRKL